MNELQTLVERANLATLLSVHIGLSLFGAIASCPTYNLPIYLFGIWAYNHHESNQPLKTFTGMLGVSIFLDVLWFILHGGNPQAESGFGFAMLLNIISLIVKPLSVFSAIQTVQNRGDSFGGVGWNQVPGAYPGGYETMRDEEQGE